MSIDIFLGIFKKNKALKALPSLFFIFQSCHEKLGRYFLEFSAWPLYFGPELVMGCPRPRVLGHFASGFPMVKVVDVMKRS